MRNPVRGWFSQVRCSLRRIGVVVVGSASLLVAGGGSAAAVSAQPNAMTFGLLGPVGLIAVALGMLGMAAGAIRQRRKSRTSHSREPHSSE